MVKNPVSTAIVLLLAVIICYVAVGLMATLTTGEVSSKLGEYKAIIEKFFPLIGTAPLFILFYALANRRWKK